MQNIDFFLCECEILYVIYGINVDFVLKNKYFWETGFRARMATQTCILSNILLQLIPCVNSIVLKLGVGVET